MKALFGYLAVLGSAAFTGTMICIGFAFGGYWTSLAPEAFLSWFAANSGFIGRTIPVVAGPAAIGLLGSLWLARGHAPSRSAWFGAFGSMIGVALITGIYHLPTNAAFVSGTIPLDEVPATLTIWLQLHAARIALGAMASGLALYGVIAAARARK